MMNKLRWVMDDGFWDLDMSTPITLDGLARPVPGDPTFPLGLSRGTRLSRPKQIDFFQRFMAAPFVPSYGGRHGFSLQRVLTLPVGDHLFATLLGQFNLQKFVSSIKDKDNDKESGLVRSSEFSWMQSIGRHLRHKSLYALGFCSELLLTPDDTILVSFEASGDKMTPPRKKAVFHHKFPHHNLTVETVWPGLFIDKSGTCWDVPLSLAFDLASVASDSGPSYHLSMHHNSGSPKQFEGDQLPGVPAALLPGFCVKSAFSFKKNMDIWRSEAQKLKMVQPYDLFLSNSHLSVSGIIGAVMTASLGDNYVRSQVANESQGFGGFSLRADAIKSSSLADIFASASFTAQYGNFQRLVLDLTRLNARLDFPSGSKFLSGTTRLAQDLYNSQQPSLEAIQAICPNATFSLQQQLVGPFSFRVDSGVVVDFKNRDWQIHVDQPVFAIEYALQVLGSAKAIAWYSPKQKEFMMELRFFES